MLIDIIISNISVSFWCLCFFFLSWKIFRIIYPPFDFPKNIPTIPFYAAFVSSFLGWDQNKVYAHYYRENLEKYGAAKIYFASRWNILVTKPEYLAQIFKQNEIFEKSGNQHKIPYSLLAEYTGDNIISTGNKYWKLYRKAVTNSIQFPNLEPLQTNATVLIENLSAASDNGYFPIADILQAYTLNNVGDCVIGTNFHKSDNFDISTSLKKVKQEIFRPLFLNFPLLDLLPFPSRIRARKLVRSFKRNYCNKILNELNEENKGRLGHNLATFWE
ncbi:putative glucosamine 6-phosphate N-acetyltransferase [Clavispora lusitaniae]|uniref:Glucosamine 6-phosphate N-acetyltransferase n=1 Tax=Clavispora lusitaniae TaxID=36911 RepID=A0ACD0WKB1_CLALS|nr:putative glucosamine 6-phosphate N-acetyltransferase [Clavispora lusitaniae]